MSNLASLGTPIHRCLDKSILALMDNVDEEKKVKVGASRAYQLTGLYKNINRCRDGLRLGANRLLPDGTPRFRSCMLATVRHHHGKGPRDSSLEVTLRHRLRVRLDNATGRDLMLMSC